MTNNVKWTTFIEQLKSRLDIVDVISKYIQVVPKGRSYWACCPFHNEKTPSFSINKQGQYYKCFGCGASGDIVNFVKEYNSLTFTEACEQLAKQANIPMPSLDLKGDSKLEQLKKEKDIMYSITVAAAQFYNSQLFTDNGVSAVKFLNGRGLSRQTIMKFGLGYSPDFNSLVNHLEKLKLPLEMAVKCGVLATNSSNKYYDALGGRVIIPIINIQSQVIGFGGRILENKGAFAKYKNTSASPIFDKSKSLFGINLLKQLKQSGELKSVIVVEGYMDAIALNQAGIINVVASMGTSLTTEQAKLILRLSSDVYICYDGDSAGQAATLRGLSILSNEGLNVKVIQMPKDIDPDELVKSQGVEQFNKLLNNALPLIDYRLLVTKRKYNFSTNNATALEEAKRKYLIDALEIINSIDNAVEKESYITYLSKQTGYTLDFIKSQLSSNSKKVEIKTDIPVVQVDKPLYYVVSCLLYSKPYAQISDILKLTNSIDDTVIISAIDYIVDCEANGKNAIPSMLYNKTDDQFKPNVDYLLQIPYTDEDTDQQYYVDCLKTVMRTSYFKQINKLESQYLQQTDDNKRKQIIQSISNLQQQLKSL